MTTGLDIGDPFRFLERQAGAFVSRCQFPKGFIPEAIDILRAAFGESWIREQVAKKVTEGSFMAPKHPLARRFSTGGKSDVAELLELAVYIKRLVRVPRLFDVITHMKNPPEYRSSFLQLAYAYRFQRIGASDMQLEPTAEEGRFGDLAFRIGGRGFIAECYVPESEGDDPIEEMKYSHKKMCDAIAEAPSKPLIARFRFKAAITPSQRKQIERHFFRMLREMADMPLTFSNECVDLQIERTSKSGLEALAPVPDAGGHIAPNTDASNVLFVKKATMEDIAKIRVGESESGNYAGVMLMWAPPGCIVAKNTTSTIEKVTENVRQKLAQTRNPAFPCRMMLLEIPVALERNQEVMAAMGILQRKLREHEGFSSAWVVSRTWRSNYRHGYGGYHLDGKEKDALPVHVFNELFDLEASGDVLSDHR